MIRRLLLALALCCGAAGAHAAACPSLPYTLTNGTLADANKVMANFNALLGCVNTSTATIANNTALKALIGSTGTVAFRQGFAAVGDGGAATYLWSDTNCANADDGAQVQPTGTGCWLVVAPAEGLSFQVWGAMPGGQVDTPLRSAIAWACRVNTTVLIPFPRTQYLLGSEIDLGNGSLGGVSTCNGVTIRVVQPYQEFFTPLGLAFAWNGSGGVVPFVVNGPAQGLNLIGIGVDCEGICSTGIKIINVANAEYGWLSVVNNVGPAFIVTSLPTTSSGLGMEGSHLHDWVAGFPGTGGSGMQVGDTACSSACAVATIADQFDNITMTFDGNTADTYGVKFGFVSQTTFTNLRVAPYSGGSSGNPILVSPPPGATGFPSDIVIYHPLTAGVIPDPGAGWTAIRGIRFDQLSTANAPYNDPSTPYPITATYGQFWGVTDQGVPFPGPTGWTPTDASGGSLSLTSSNTLYHKSGSQCTVQFKITWPSNSDSGHVATIGAVPCVPLPGSFAVAGGGVAFTDQGTPLSVSCTNAIGQCLFYDFTGAALTNLGLSTKTVAGSITFLSE